MSKVPQPASAVTVGTNQSAVERLALEDAADLERARHGLLHFNIIEP